MSATTAHQNSIPIPQSQSQEEELLGYKVVRKADSEPPHLCFSCKAPIAIYGRCVHIEYHIFECSLIFFNH
jgi:hypothetical protein